MRQPNGNPLLANFYKLNSDLKRELDCEDRKYRETLPERHALI